MRNGLREMHVSLKPPRQAYAVGVLLSQCLRGVRFALKPYVRTFVKSSPRGAYARARLRT